MGEAGRKAATASSSSLRLRIHQKDAQIFRAIVPQAQEQAGLPLQHLQSDPSLTTRLSDAITSR